LEKVSIIVPVYNGEERLDLCIRSILLQTYKNLEIIIVNDGSTDGSSDIINHYYKENQSIIKVIEQKNSGVSSARNRGLEEATGDYIMFVDADDRIHSACVETALRNAKQNDADITRFRMVYEYVDGTQKLESSDFSDKAFIQKKDFKKHVYDKMITGIKLNTIFRTLYKKNVIENIRFREDMVTAEDLVFNIDAFTKAKNFLYLPYPYYYYYQSNQGLTGKGVSTLKKYKCNLIVSVVLFQHLKQWDMFTFPYILKTVLRLLFITLSKIKRRFLKRV